MAYFDPYPWIISSFGYVDPYSPRLSLPFKAHFGGATVHEQVDCYALRF